MRNALPLEALLARPRLTVGSALVLLTVLAWWHLLATSPPAAGPGSLIDLCVSSAARAGRAFALPAPMPWQGGDFVLALFMWLVMVLAMMLPTAAPAILAFADINAAAPRRTAWAARVGAFAVGYLLVWCAFGGLGTVAQWAVALAALGVPSFSAGSPLPGGVLLLVAGLYQWSALKNRCLSQCRSPLTFFLARWREGVRGAFAMGCEHGLHCVGCCWALMALMLVAGTMNLAWTAGLAVLMLLEKVAPGGPLLGRAVGLGLMAWGGVLLGTTA